MIRQGIFPRPDNLVKNENLDEIVPSTKPKQLHSSKTVAMCRSNGKGVTSCGPVSFSKPVSKNKFFLTLGLEYARNKGKGL